MGNTTYSERFLALLLLLLSPLFRCSPRVFWNTVISNYKSSTSSLRTVQKSIVKGTRHHVSCRSQAWILLIFCHNSFHLVCCVSICVCMNMCVVFVWGILDFIKCRPYYIKSIYICIWVSLFFFLKIRTILNLFLPSLDVNDFTPAVLCSLVIWCHCHRSALATRWLYSWSDYLLKACPVLISVNDEKFFGFTGIILKIHKYNCIIIYWSKACDILNIFLVEPQI